MVQDTKTDPNLIVVAFRGTEPFDANAWCTDFDFSWYELRGIGKIHRGFMKALGLQKDGWPNEIAPDNHNLYAYYEIRRVLKEILNKNENAKFIVTGHSLGGALAILFVAVLAIQKEGFLLDKMEGVYTFGQPRVGDRQFGKFMQGVLKEYDVRYLRYVYCNDMVPRLPYDDSTLLYKHFGPCLYYDSLYQGKVLWEEPNKNYFNLLWAIPKNINAVWELIRSFILPWVKGQNYREGWFMTVFRIIGLLIPGLSAHTPQDYDNSTRLGSLPQEFHRD
ncbi:triacylglycerol lipase OBL1 [Jatropha curcas]|nr:triacylglycerol lipase OBL1 [Jatropha curcas]